MGNGEEIWQKIRQDYPICEKMVYFQSAGMSPLNQPVFQSMCDKYRDIRDYGDINWERDLDDFRHLCGRLGKLINGSGEDITFLTNTSLAMSMVALSLKNQMETPFNVVSMEDEFPATNVPFEYQGIEMRYVQPRDHRYPIEEILASTDKNTLAVVTSYVQYCTGFRQNLAGLGQELKARNILFIVNATQAVPYFPVDVQQSHIDVLSASLHKWAGTAHVGAMFYTSQQFRETYPPPVAGWLSVDPGEYFIHTRKNVPLKLFNSAKCYETGTMNLQPYQALATALQYFEGVGLEIISKRLLDLGDTLIQGLRQLPVTIISPIKNRRERSAIVSIDTESDNQSLVAKLEEKSIYTAFRNGYIRIALNIFNNHQDIDHLLDELKKQLVG
jgi:selenocysteine lyase/cysteine desulfurase